MSVIERIKEKIEAEKAVAIPAPELERMLEFRRSDAMREGSSCTTQEYGWGNGEKACALSAASLSLKARGYL